jgi:hypothetical protein
MVMKMKVRSGDGWPLCPICGNDELAVIDGRVIYYVCDRVGQGTPEAMRAKSMMDQVEAKWRDECQKN